MNAQNIIKEIKASDMAESIKEEIISKISWNKGNPTEDGNYLVHDGFKVYVAEYRTDLGFGRTFTFRGEQDFLGDSLVVAWMTLPKFD